MMEQTTSRTLFQMRRRLEAITEEMSLAITIEYDLSNRLDQAIADLKRIQRALEQTEQAAQ